MRHEYPDAEKGGKEVLTVIMEDTDYLKLVCPCGRLYVAPKGRKLIQGPVYSATVVVDHECVLGRSVFDLWWRYFNVIGQADAIRNE